MSCYSDYKPHDYVHGECVECGFSYHTITKQLSLDELNEARKEYNETSETYDKLEMLTELPKMNEDLIFPKPTEAK